jgi:hypothetical protein
VGETLLDGIERRRADVAIDYPERRNGQALANRAVSVRLNYRRIGHVVNKRGVPESGSAGS